MQASEDMPLSALERVRTICLGFPGAIETTSFGHPTWKARKKAFAVFEKYRGDWSVALKADPDEQRALIETDARFYRTPYTGQQGWVSFKLQGRIPWRRLEGLLLEAHRLVC
jgi:predicted DNA-binding protein (MmcQ/YjbR family)